MDEGNVKRRVKKKRWSKLNTCSLLLEKKMITEKSNWPVETF